MQSGRITALATAVSLGLAFAPVAAHADVRIEEHAATLGSKVKRWTFIQGTRRSVVTRAEPKGLLYDAGAQYDVTVEIARPDRNLLWELHPQKRTYREIPASSFRSLLQQASLPPRSANDQPLRTLYISEPTDVAIKPTGKQRRIAGLPAEQVLASVEIGALNQVSGGRLRFRFEQEVWLCKDPRLVREVRQAEDAYFQSFGALTTLAQARLLSGYWSDAFIPHVQTLQERLRALGGYPLAITTTVREEALAQSQGEKTTRRQQVVGTSEVRSVDFSPLPASEFEVPAGYVNLDTNIAVQPAGTAAAPAEKPASPQPSPTAAATAPSRPSEYPSPAAGLPSHPASPIQPGTPIVTAPPSNVIVPGRPLPAAQSASKSGKAKQSRAPVSGPAASQAPSSQPVFRPGIATTATPPPPVTIDQPIPEKRKRR